MNDRTVLVTGGARRVGAAICRRLHASGANVMIHYRASADAAQRLRDELERVRPGSARIVGADILDVDALPGVVAETVRAFGRLDALVNNASTFFPTPVGTITLAAWDDLVGTNLKAPLFLSQAAAPELARTQGSIVNITDIHAERPLKNYAVYSLAKAGLAGLTRALARELAPHVRVNAVAPGPIIWPEDDSFDEAAREGIAAHTLLKRIGDPEDIAKAVHFLIADAGYVTGETINVDGGRHVAI